MAARRYKISFRVLKIFHEWAQWTSEIFFQHEKRNFVSPSGHVMFYLLYKHQWTTKPFHFNSFVVWKARLLCSHSSGDIFTREDNMLFSHVKISSFRAKAHLVFHWCLYNNIFYFIYFSPFATKGGWMIDDKGWSAMRQKQWSCFVQLSLLAECFIIKICVQQHLPHFSNKMAGPFSLLWLWGVESNILLLFVIISQY